MFQHDTTRLKACISSMSDYSQMTQKITNAISQRLSGYKGPVTRPSLETPREILEAQMFVDGKELVIRSDPSQVITTAIITTSCENGISQNIADCIQHRYKKVIFDRVWISQSIMQYRCIIKCDYIALDTIEEVKKFWMTLVNVMFPGCQPCFAYRCITESWKDFFFTNMTQILNVKTIINKINTVNINDDDDESVIPYTAFEMFIEFNMPFDVQDVRLTREIACVVKKICKQVSDNIVAIPCIPEATLLNSFASSMPCANISNTSQTTCGQSLDSVLQDLESALQDISGSNVNTLTSDSFTYPSCSTQCFTPDATSLEEALAEINAIQDSFRSKITELVNKSKVDDTKQIMPRNSTSVTTSITQPPLTPKHPVVQSTVVAPVNNVPTNVSTNVSTDAQLDNLCKILENFISTISEKPQ